VNSIQLISRFNRGGTAEWLKVLIPGLRSQPSNVEIYAGYVELSEIEDPAFVDLGGKRIVSLGRGVSVINDLQSFLKFRQVLKLEKPNILNTHTSKAGVIGRLAAISLGKRRPALVHTFHGHLLYGYFKGLKLFMVILTERLLARRTDVLISAGVKVRTELLQAKIGKVDQYVIARPGVSVLNFKKDLDYRHKLGISKTTIIVSWLGRLTAIKRPDRVLEIAKAFPNLVFLIGGEGELAESLQASKPKNVHLLGWVKPTDLWASSDIALLTSDNEAQPIALIESGFFGIPAVAENVGSVSEVVLDQITGFLTESYEERIHAISTLVTNSEIRILMGERAKEHCIEMFSIEKFVKKHVAAYEKAIIMRHNG
jgi:glycosyltransferase involved in cell wall biosynthesis